MSMSRRTPPPLNRIITRLVDSGYEFFVNSLLDPVVHIPDDPYQKTWGITHERFLAHLSAIYHAETKGDYLKPSDRDLLIELLKEECFKGGQRMTEVEAALVEKDSIVQALLLYLSKGKDGFDGPTRILLGELRNDSIQDRIIPPDPNFPVLTNIFSRRVNLLRSALQDLGVRLEIKHSEAGSTSRLSKLATFEPVADGFTKGPSGEPSVANLAPAKGTDAPDGTDATKAPDERNHPFVTDPTKPKKS